MKKYRGYVKPFCLCTYMPRVGPGHFPPFLIPSLPHLLLYILVSFTFSLFPFLTRFIFFLFRLFPFYQNSSIVFQILTSWLSAGRAYKRVNNETKVTLQA